MAELQNQNSVNVPAEDSWNRKFWVSYWIAIVIADIILSLYAQFFNVVDSCCPTSFLIKFAKFFGPLMVLISFVFLIIGIVKRNKLKRNYWWMLILFIFVGFILWIAIGWMTSCLCGTLVEIPE